MPKSRDNLATFLKEDYLNENISITLLKPAPKIEDSQVHQRHDVATFDTKSEKAQYEKSQRGGEDGKDKKGGKDGEGKRSEEGH